MLSPSRDAQGRPPGDRRFREQFLRDVLRLLDEGAGRLKGASLAVDEETAITGKLVQAMQQVCMSRRWAWRYVPHDDPPVNTGGRTGRRRLRVDIRIDRAMPGRRPSFSIEAKLLPGSGLGHSASAHGYLGQSGLQCFLDGRYASEDLDVGMLAYVREDEPADWADRVREGCTVEADALKLTGGFRSWWGVRLAHLVYVQSPHRRGQQEIIVHHLFMDCR